MMKLLVVDDEFFVRKGIIESIEWSKYDIEICGEASNGMEALPLVEQLHPDCVLTDLKMGKMDGLEFIERAKQIDSNIVFVILSGYDDFEDARKAISLGVSEYLLKPLGADELINIILKIKKQFDSTSSLYAANNPSLQNSIMLSWNTPQNTTFSMDHSFFRVFTFRAEHWPTHTLLPLNEISNIVEEYLSLAGISHIVKSYHYNLFMVMLNYKDSVKDCTEFLNCFSEFLHTKNNLEIIIGCGSEYFGYHNIAQSYNEAFAALAFHYCQLSDPIVYSDSVPHILLRKYMCNPTQQNLKREINFFSDINELSAEQYFSKLYLLFQKFSTHKISLEEAKTLFLRICITNLNKLNLPAHAIVQRINLYSLFDIEHCETYEQLKADMTDFFYKMADSHSVSYDINNYQHIISLVMQYVYSHYGEDISLSLLSSKVHLTPNYLSKIFKDTVGINFKEWLTQYRITKSQELLRESSHKVYEICSMVGFNDYKHFSSVFKKYVGCSAKEYRTSHLQSDFSENQNERAPH
ncbi:response regulator [Faecalicatena sp. Marseille-Q4148]|nr:response regulator [Faecalicatena sp. Marseille-Q4148]